MAEVSGVIGRVKDKPFGNKTFWSFTLRNQDGWYNTGVKRPPPEGTAIKFEFSVNGKGYNEVNYHSIQELKDAPAESSPGVERVVSQVSRYSGNGTGLNKDTYFLRKEERDVANDEKRELGASRNTAISIIDLMLKHEVIKLPAQAKREEFIWELIGKYTDQLMGTNRESVVEAKEEVPVVQTPVAIKEEWN